MKRNAKSLIIVLCALMVIASLTVPAFAKVKQMTVTGTINEKGALVADNGKAYTVAQNHKGMELVKMVNQKVEVKGSVKTKSGQKIITVSSFKEI